MTDRIRTVTVTLDRDVRTDDAAAILNAIRMVKGVAAVDEGPPLNMADYLARRSALSKFILFWDEFSRLAVAGGDPDRAKFEAISELLEASYRTRTGRG